MTHPDTTSLIGRYQAYRTRRFLANERKWAQQLPSWRTRDRKRKLVVGLAATFVFMFAVGVVCNFGIWWGPLLWLPACALFFPLLIAVRIVSGRQDDAPEATLDEWEIAQRNSARSIGLAVTQSLVTVAAMYLIFGAVITDNKNGDLVYAGGIFVLTALLIGSCTPAMILAWTRPDLEPDDES